MEKSGRLRCSNAPLIDGLPSRRARGSEWTEADGLSTGAIERRDDLEVARARAHNAVRGVIDRRDKEEATEK